MLPDWLVTCIVSLENVYELGVSHSASKDIGYAILLMAPARLFLTQYIELVCMLDK